MKGEEQPAPYEVCYLDQNSGGQSGQEQQGGAKSVKSKTKPNVGARSNSNTSRFSRMITSHQRLTKDGGMSDT